MTLDASGTPSELATASTALRTPAIPPVPAVRPTAAIRPIEASRGKVLLHPLNVDSRRQALATDVHNPRPPAILAGSQGGPSATIPNFWLKGRRGPFVSEGFQLAAA